MNIEDLLKKAINRIGERNFKVENPQTRVITEKVHSLDYSRRATHPENNFVSYLVAYYLIELDSMNRLEQDDFTIYPQAQLYKKLVYKEENKEIIDTFKFDRGLIPDLVFHKNQNDNDPENQKIAIECKIDVNLTYSSFSKDLAKLIIYISELNFQKSIFIIANMSDTEIIKYINQFKNKYSCYSDVLASIEIWIKNYDKELIVMPLN